MGFKNKRLHRQSTGAVTTTTSDEDELHARISEYGQTSPRRTSNEKSPRRTSNEVDTGNHARTSKRNTKISRQGTGSLASTRLSTDEDRVKFSDFGVTNKRASSDEETKRRKRNTFRRAGTGATDSDRDGTSAESAEE